MSLEIVMTRLTGTLALALTLSMLLHAQGALTGEWHGQTPSGASILMALTANGSALTGTMTVGPQKSAIESGKVSKNTFAFSVAMGGGTEAFTGEVAGDEIRMWMDDRGPSTAITLKRVKPAQK
jgi:hypothetical protein